MREPRLCDENLQMGAGMGRLHPVLGFPPEMPQALPNDDAAREAVATLLTERSNSPVDGAASDPAVRQQVGCYHEVP